MKKPEHARLCCTTSAFLKIFRSLLTPWVLPSPQLLHALVGEADYGVTLRDPEVLPTKGTVHIVPRQHARTRGSSSLVPCTEPQLSPSKLPLVYFMHLCKRPLGNC